MQAALRPPTDDFDAKSAKLVFAGVWRSEGNVYDHAHPCMELILIEKGACDVDMGGQRLHAEAGQLMVVPARMAHNQISDGPIQTVYCGLVEPQAMTTATPYVVSLQDSTFIEQCMLLMSSVYLAQREAAPAAMDLLLASMLEELNHQRSMNRNRQHLPERLWEAIRHMQTHLDQPITIESVAQAVRLSPSNVHLLFRTHLKTTPMRYLLEQRMRVARTVLQTPYLSVKEVAGICGYPDVNHFVRTFRKVHGTPPGRWRRTS